MDCSTTFLTPECQPIRLRGIFNAGPEMLYNVKMGKYFCCWLLFSKHRIDDRKRSHPLFTPPYLRNLMAHPGK